jgi:manganese/zinc/iron transport system substrate-binding protein
MTKNILKNDVFINFLKPLCYIILIFLGSCEAENKANLSKNINEKPKIVVTTNILGDLIQNVTGKNFEIQVLMGAGTDPHSYKARQSDLKKLYEADIIIYGGLHLEGKMQDVFGKLSKKKKVIESGALVNNNLLIPLDNTLYDPHIWFDVNIWIELTKELSNSLIKFYPEHTKDIKEYTKDYLKQLEDLNNYIENRIAEIPDNQKILITSHDAFQYFGKAYHIKVRGLQGISTAGDYGLRNIIDLTNYIIENNVKAIFAETSVSSQSLEAVFQGCKSRGHQIQLISDLYSDSLGNKKSSEGTYIGMMKANIDKITKALK